MTTTKAMREHRRSVSCPATLNLSTTSVWFAQNGRNSRQFRSFQSVLLRIGWRPVSVMSRSWKRWPEIALSLLFACVSARAQTVQFLPEVDSYLKLTRIFRVYYEAKDDRDGGDSTQVTNGPSIQMYLKPLIKLKKITTFDLDDSKPRALVFEAGYRYITAPDKPNDNRFLTSVTSHFPMKAAFLITDRNRADLDWKGGTFNWRYRNKLTLERTFAIRSYHLIPYVALEPYYTSQYGKWSTTTEFAGCLFPVGKHVEFNPYYEHENDTGSKHGNKQENYIGLAVYLYFSVERKPPAN
jgi:hypothetical protein